MRSPRRVTLHPIARPSRTLNVATDLRARHITGFCPVIFARSPAAASMTFLSATASPTPMFTVILVILGTSIALVMPRPSRSWGTTVSR